MVGKSDFNENPVVSLGLDLDFGLRLRVCQWSENNRKSTTDVILHAAYQIFNNNSKKNCDSFIATVE